MAGCVVAVMVMVSSYGNSIIFCFLLQIAIHLVIYNTIYCIIVLKLLASYSILASIFRNHFRVVYKRAGIQLLLMLDQPEIIS